MRQLAVTSAALMLLLALGAALHAWWIVAVFAVSAVITVADNGLAYVAVAETGRTGLGRAGARRAEHRAEPGLGGDRPMLAAIIGESRYALGFAVVAIFPLLAVPLTPVRARAAAP